MDRVHPDVSGGDVVADLKTWNPYGDADYGPDGYKVYIELRDGNANLVGVVNDYTDATFAFSADASDVEASSITLPWSSPWAKTFMRANVRLLLVHAIIYRDGVQITAPWTGRVDRAVRKMEGPQGSVSVELVSDKQHLKFIQAWSSPGTSLNIQAPKNRTYFGPAVHTLKRVLSDNLIRLSGTSVIDMARNGDWMDDRASWVTMSQRFPGHMIVPTPRAEDNSQNIVTQVRMTTMDEVWQEACKDYNLLPTARMFIPGRDPQPSRLALDKPTVVYDIVDKDKSRTQREIVPRWKAAFQTLGTFVRGLFGQYDVPQTIDVYDPESLADFFGRQPTDPWVIFRDSSQHWASREVCSYAPTASTSISGGKAQGFLNKGVQILFNLLIRSAFAAIGMGFVGLDIGGTFDDILFAYQKADDKEMREFLGDFTYFEEFVGDGMTAYSFDAAQSLRSARYGAVGYQTAMFTGDLASFRPFRPFEDFGLLDPVGWEDSVEDRIFTERVKQIIVTMSRDRRIAFEVRLGELERPEEPTAIAQRRHESMVRALNNIIRRD